jgi:hypothetical protein
MASPSAVPPSGSMLPSARRTTSRSSVGGVRTSAAVENRTTPILTFSGTSSTKVRAAAWAASKRFGATSVAIIDSEVSMVRTTEASSVGTSTVRCGRAAPTSRAESASSISAGGTWRRHAGVRPTTPASRSRFVNRAA